MTFEENIKTWVSLDNKIKSYNESLRNLREEKNKIETEVMRYADSELPDNSVIKISDGLLKLTEIKQQQPLTYKYVQECLNNVISDKEKVSKIINYIKENKPEKKNKGIKRVYEN